MRSFGKRLRRNVPHIGSFMLNLAAILGAICIAWTLALVLFGVKPLVFVSGSMAPEYPVGSVGFARTIDASEAEVDDVVSVINVLGDRVTHRVVEVTTTDGVTELQLRGDANNAVDGEIYQPAVVDRVDAHVPWLGYVLMFAGSVWGIAGGIVILVSALGFAILSLLRSRRAPRDPSGADEDDLEAPRDSDRDRETNDDSRFARTARVIVGVAVVGALGLGANASSTQPTLAYFTDNPRAATPASGFDAAPWFTCGDVATAAGLDAYLYFELNETTGTTIFDSSGNGRSAFTQGSPLLGQTGSCARDTETAIRTQIGTDVVTNGLFTDPAAGPAGNRWNNFTISLWFKQDPGEWGPLAVMQAGSSHDRKLYIDLDGVLRWGVYRNSPTGAFTLRSAPGVNYRDGEWHMITASLSPNGMKMWVDGISVGSTLEQGGSASSVTQGWQGYGAAAYYIFGKGQSQVGSWPGAKDVSTKTDNDVTLNNIGIWMRELTDAQVRDMYRASMPSS